MPIIVINTIEKYLLFVGVCALGATSYSKVYYSIYYATLRLYFIDINVKDQI
jgi:hypothetical protein